MNNVNYLNGYMVGNTNNNMRYLNDNMDDLITEKDFYPPEDTRFYNSGIDDIYNGDSFEDYVSWFYENYEDEIFDT